MTEPVLPLTALMDGRRIDWERVIIDIQRSSWLAGASQRMSETAIAKECGRGRNWVWCLKNIPGTEPKFHDALLLIGLWSNVTGGGADGLPICRDFDHSAS